MNISVLILAKNEEKNIRACIESVSFAEEVIVIDDFSTDRTREIALSLGAKVVQHGLDGNWGAQQTFAIEQATKDWIFFIDADERVTPRLLREITKAMEKDDRTVAYRNARLSYFWGQKLAHGGWFPDYVTRLIPRKDTWVEGFVHPRIVHPYREVEFPKDAYMLHYPYRDWEHYFGKFNLYTTLAAKKSYEAGKRAHLWDFITHPMWAAFRMYILQGGFLDGKVGFILASFHYAYTMAKYVKLYFLDRENPHIGESSSDANGR